MPNAVSESTIKDLIYSWIASRDLISSDQRIYFEDQNIQRPRTPCISFAFLTGLIQVGGRDNSSYDNDESSFVVSGPRNISVSIKSYGEGAGQIMNNLHASLELFAVQQLFQAQNIAVREAGPVQKLSLLLETGIEERYGMDLSLGVSSIQAEDQGSIDIVNYSGEVKDASGATLQTTDDTVTKP